MADNHKSQLTIIVNGQPTVVEVNPNAALGSVVERALKQTHNLGQPAENWEIRDADGRELPLNQKIKDFHFAPGVHLFLNLKAGVGG